MNKNKLNGHGKSIVVPLPRNRRHGIRGSDIEPTSVQWLKYPTDPMGELVIVAGMGGVGKGLMVADRAARVTTGATWPFSNEHAPLGNVVWCEAEDKLAPTVVPRLIAAGADMDRVTLYTGEQAKEFHREIKREDIIRDNTRVIVLSPLVSFLPELNESNAELDVRRCLSPVESRIAELPCTLYGIMHLNKKGDQAAMQRIGGASAFVNVARAAFVLRAESRDVTRVGHIKYNLSFKAEDMLFTKVHRKPSKPKTQFVGIDWSEAKETVAEDTFFDKRKENSTETADAWLVKVLKERGKLDLKSIQFLADTSGHSWDAVHKAKKRNKKIKHSLQGTRNNRETYWWLR